MTRISVRGARSIGKENFIAARARQYCASISLTQSDNLSFAAELGFQQNAGRRRGTTSASETLFTAHARRRRGNFGFAPSMKKRSIGFTHTRSRVHIREIYIPASR